MESKLREILADVFDVNAEDSDDSLTAENVNLWNSLNHLRMITVIEEEFQVTFAMDEIGQMTSYASIVEVLSKHIQKK